jgi:hypothetical protein
LEALLLGPPGWPFAKYPELPAALKVVTEDFRLWSPGAPLMPLLLTMAGWPTAGTAGWMGFWFLPFTGEIELFLPWCAFWEPPTATGGAALDAIGGDCIFLVALAYDRAAGGAEPAATLDDDPVVGAVVAEALWLAAVFVGFGALEMEALIRKLAGWIEMSMQRDLWREDGSFARGVVEGRVVVV